MSGQRHCSSGMSLHNFVLRATPWNNLQHMFGLLNGHTFGTLWFHILAIPMLFKHLGMAHLILNLNDFVPECESKEDLSYSGASDSADTI